MSGRKVEFKENSGGGAGDRRFLEMADLLEHDAHALFDRDARLEAELLRDAGRVGVRGVRLARALRNVNDGAAQ